MDIERAKEALRAADAAGDTAAATELARAIRAAESPQRSVGERALNYAKAVGWGGGQRIVSRARSIGNMVGLVSDEDLEAARKRDAPLASTTPAKVGGFIGDVAATGLGGASLPALAAGGALLGATEEGADTWGERLKGAGIGGALGAGGGVLAKWGANKIAQRSAAQALRKAQNAPIDEALAAGRRQGLVVSPQTTNPSLLNWAMESIAGKAATQQAGALKNAPKMQDAARKFLELPPDAPITTESLQKIHQQSAAAREAIKGLGGRMRTDMQFARDLAAAEGAGASAARSFPGLGTPDKYKTLHSLRQLDFRPDDAVDAIKSLRESATESFATRQGMLGRAQRSAAKAMEDVIERNLERQGLAGAQMLQNFRKARIMDAKAYAVERVINKATGNIKGAKIASEFSKGVPLTGEMRDVAKFASAFGKAAKEPSDSAGVNALRMMFGVEGLAAGHPELLAAPLAGHGLAKYLTSGLGQRIHGTPSYAVKAKIPRLAKGLGRVIAPTYLATEDEEDE